MFTLIQIYLHYDSKCTLCTLAVFFLTRPPPRTHILQRWLITYFWINSVPLWSSVSLSHRCLWQRVDSQNSLRYHGGKNCPNSSLWLRYPFKVSSGNTWERFWSLNISSHCFCSDMFEVYLIVCLFRYFLIHLFIFLTQKGGDGHSVSSRCGFIWRNPHVLLARNPRSVSDEAVCGHGRRYATVTQRCVWDQTISTNITADLASLLSELSYRVVLSFSQ